MGAVVSMELIKGKQTNVCNDAEVIPSHALTYLTDCLGVWAQVFPREGTWVQQNYGVPSVIVRFDLTLTGDRIGVYEIEERPAGIGSTCRINPSFLGRLSVIREHWPSFSVVVSPSRCLDDAFWAREKSPDQLSGELVFPRVDPNEFEYHRLESRCLSVLRQEGSKAYGVHLGWWRKVTARESNDLPWDQSFALKPLRGTRCKGLVIYSSLSQSKRPRNTVSRGRALQELHQQEAMYLQELIPSMVSRHIPGHDVIWRFYFGYDAIRGVYVPLGGLWNSRPNSDGRGNCKIHGAEDAVFGPLIMEGE